MKTAIVLFNLGGPLKPDDVKLFLFNLFYDKAIIDLPNPFRWILAKLISGLREKKAIKIYEKLGGSSPLLENTKRQALGLEKKLSRHLKCRVFISMRYWHPFCCDVIKELEEYGPDQILLLPLYPQFSSTTTGSSFEDFYKSQSASSLSNVPTKGVCCFFGNSLFIDAHVSLIVDELKKIKQPSTKISLLFSAHGLPISVIEKGDPYEDQMKKTVSLIMKKLEKQGINHVICYQSKVGLKKWLGPSTQEAIIEAGKRGDSIVVVPVSFVSEHSETLVELDMEYRDFATKNGVKSYHRVKALGTNEIFLDSLKDMCLKLLKIVTTEKDILVSDNISYSCSDQFCKCKNNYKK